MSRPVSRNADSFTYNARGEMGVGFAIGRFFDLRLNGAKRHASFVIPHSKSLCVSAPTCDTVPGYDANGNVTRYLDASGRTVAQYVYDAFGGMVAASGPLADTFTFGFSTKCRDREACLVAYQRRFYSPGLGRWLNRDPIGEIDDGCMSIGNWGAQFRQSFDEGEQVVGRLSYLMLS